MNEHTFTKEEQLAIIAAVKETYGFGSSYASERLGWSVCVFFLAIIHPIFLIIGIFSVIVAALSVQQKLLTEYATRGVCPVDSELKHFPRSSGSSIPYNSDRLVDAYRPYSPTSRFFHTNQTHKTHWK